VCARVCVRARVRACVRARATTYNFLPFQYMHACMLMFDDIRMTIYLSLKIANFY
jgi:hypothetical protein